MRTLHKLLNVILVAVIVLLLLSVAISLSGCGIEPQTPETSSTFVGKVISFHTETEKDDEDKDVIVVFVDVLPDGSPRETFTVDNGLPIENEKRYAFRAWTSPIHRHLSEAIPIP